MAAPPLRPPTATAALPAHVDEAAAPERPLLAAALALCFGAWCGQVPGGSPSIWAGRLLGAALLATALAPLGSRWFPRARARRGSWLALAALALAAGLRVHHEQRFPVEVGAPRTGIEHPAAPSRQNTTPLDPTPPEPAPSAADPERWEGRIASWFPGRGGARSRGALRRSSPGAPGQIDATVGGPPPGAHEQVQVLAPGELVRPARGPATSEEQARPWRRWAVDELLRLGPAEFPGPLARLRGILLGRVRSRLPERHTGFLSALLLGERSELERDVGDLFTRTGLRHLLAVSGLHVALLLGALVGPLAGLVGRGLAPLTPLSQRAAERLVRAFLLLLFVPLAGAAAPVVRAALAAVLAGFAGCMGAPGHGIGRRIDPLSLWAAALALEACVDPRSVGLASVQLSYAAVLALVLCTAPLTRFFGAGHGASGAASPFTRPGPLAAARSRLRSAVASSLAASCAATLGTLPIVWARFGEFSPWGVLLTPLAVPCLTVLLVGGWLALLTPLPYLDRVVGAVAELSLHGLALADRLPATPFVLPERPSFLLALLVAATCLRLARSSRASRTLRRSVRWVWALVLVPWTAGARSFELHALDVGHGTCVVFRAPGEPAWIFDAGSRSRPFPDRGALGPLLRSWETRRPSLVLSHDHRDHASALDWLLERYPPRRALGAVSARWSERLPHDCDRIGPARGSLALGIGARSSRVPWSVRLVRGHELEGNEGSRSLLVTWRRERLLLTGDAEEEGLAPLLAGPPTGLAPRRSDRSAGRGAGLRLLLAPHHGTSGGRVPDLLDAWRPREVWFSAKDRPPLADELDRRGVPWRSTASEGPLALFLQ